MGRYGHLYHLFCAFFLHISQKMCNFASYNKRTSSWIQLANLWAEWSWHSSTFPSSSRIRPGRNSEVCWQTILPRVNSPNCADARSYRRKSTLFTSTWGTRKVPYFRGFQSTQTLWRVNSNFMTCKHWLYSEQCVSLCGSHMQSFLSPISYQLIFLPTLSSLIGV